MKWEKREERRRLGMPPTPEKNWRDILAQRPMKPPGPPRLTGKVIGYRAWTLDGYRLKSGNAVQHGGFWEIGANRAVCRIKERARYLADNGDPSALSLPALRVPVHDAPHPDCECGLYAWFEVNRNSGKLNAGGGLTVYGAVVAWGRIEVHADGFRAEYAEPVALAYQPRDPYEDVVKAQTMAGELGLPFVTLDELPAEAAKHGQDLPDELRLKPEPKWLAQALRGEVGLQALTAPRHVIAFTVPLSGSNSRVVLSLGREIRRRGWDITVWSDPLGGMGMHVHLEGPSDEEALAVIRAAAQRLGFAISEETLVVPARYVL